MVMAAHRFVSREPITNQLVLVLQITSCRLMERHAKVSLVICLSFLLDCLFSYYLPAFYVLFKKIRMSVLSSLKTRGEAESFYT